MYSEETKELAREAYEAFRGVRERPLPTWDELSNTEQQTWFQVVSLTEDYANAHACRRAFRLDDERS